MKGTVLVIGYGNELRGDDAVGPLVARAVTEWNRPEVRTLEGHQLVAEMVAEMEDVETVVFADASLTEETASLKPLPEGRGRTRLGHFSEPGWLLELARLMYRRRPAGWVLAIPVERLGFGQPLSPRARAGVRDAMSLLGDFLDSSR
jgi:hydrogenase maturation protease